MVLIFKESCKKKIILEIISLNISKIYMWIISAYIYNNWTCFLIIITVSSNTHCHSNPDMEYLDIPIHRSLLKSIPHEVD